jgi:hypothetical protein
MSSPDRGRHRQAIDEALVNLHEAKDQLRQQAAASAEAETSEPVCFSTQPPSQLDEEARQGLEDQIERLSPWPQGPFVLADDVVVCGQERSDFRWRELQRLVPDSFTGLRVLAVNSAAGYDAFMSKLRGAEYVLATECGKPHRQARFLESIYHTGVDFQELACLELDESAHGRFDLAYLGALHREPHQLMALQRMRAMLAAGAPVLVASMVLAAPELSEFIRFVPASNTGDASWSCVPGRLALRWMLEATGFEADAWLTLADAPRGDFPVHSCYVRARTAPDR